MEIQQTLQQFACNQTNQAPVSVPTSSTVEPILDEPIQGVTPANADNLSATWPPVILTDELNVQGDATMFKWEKETASSIF